MGIMGWTRKSNQTANRVWDGQHRFEHWYRDNQVYFITARCREQFPAFASEEAKEIFWDYFNRLTDQFGFHPWVTSLLDNHYHTIGYLEVGENLPKMMRRLHGAVAKLVNDLLEAQYQARQLQLPCPPLNDQGRLLPFWRDTKNKNYFDGWLRDAKQGRLTYQYVLKQAVRHGIAGDWRAYPHTRIGLAFDKAMHFAEQRGAYLTGVPYKRYEQGRGT